MVEEEDQKLVSASLEPKGGLLTVLKSLRPQCPLFPSKKWGCESLLMTAQAGTKVEAGNENKCAFPAWPGPRQNSRYWPQSAYPPLLARRLAEPQSHLPGARLIWTRLLW